MTRDIKASEVREGMEIEWSDRGWFHRGEVAAVTRNHPGGVWVQSSDGFEMSVEPGQVFTVVSEPQPDEPTASGACVEVAGVKYVRCDDDEFEWKSSDGNGWWRWSDLCDKGQVTIINADPFANTEPREPRVWKRWADVPELTPVRTSVSVETLYRKVGDRIECGLAGSWAPAYADEYDLNKYSPFTEVLVSTVS